MYKKIGISFLALVFIFNFSMKDYADAAIASKAASQAAKQVAKEVIQEAAINQAANYAVMQAMQFAEDYQKKPGYKIICPSGASTCDKPIQVKETISDSDKQAIKGQAGSELDKLLNGGAGVSKWQKFMDWFLPVWLISFGATALTYAFDSDVRSLFNEAGYNALVALGFIIPIEDSSVVTPITEEEDTDFNEVPPASEVYPDMWSTVIEPSPNYITEVRATSPDLNWQVGNGLYEFKVTNSNLSSFSISLNGTSNFVNDTLLSMNKANNGFSVKKSLIPNPISIRIALNGETVKDITAVKSEDTSWKVFDLTSTYGSMVISSTTSVKHRLPYQLNGFWYSDTLVTTSDGNQYHYQLKSEGHTITNVNIVRFYAGTPNTSKNFGISAAAYRDKTPYKQVLPPVFSEAEAELDIMQSSSYQDESGNVALIPPTALTYKEESTGETVYRTPNPVPTEPAIFQKEDGTPVPEENITVDPAPTVIPAPAGSTTEKGEPIPEGTPTVTPTPTPTNPAPAPIPLTPSQPAPDPSDPTTPPANGEEPPMEPFPEGESCQEKLKFPIFSPLKEQFSTSFPFSIPWDMERAINAAFAEIGNDRPEFTLDLAFMGETKEIKIGVPKFFDNWKPFTDTLLLLTFDILIMFGVYRFVKGAGS